jgi:hypothetical protein
LLLCCQRIPEACPLYMVQAMQRSSPTACCHTCKHAPPAVQRSLPPQAGPCPALYE